MQIDDIVGTRSRARAINDIAGTRGRARASSRQIFTEQIVIGIEAAGGIPRHTWLSGGMYT